MKKISTAQVDVPLFARCVLGLALEDVNCTTTVGASFIRRPTWFQFVHLSLHDDNILKFSFVIAIMLQMPGPLRIGAPVTSLPCIFLDEFRRACRQYNQMPVLAVFCDGLAAHECTLQSLRSCSLLALFTCLRLGLRCSCCLVLCCPCFAADAMPTLVAVFSLLTIGTS